MPLSNVLANTTLGKVFNDRRLYGESLTTPLKWCASFISETITSWPGQGGFLRRTVQAVKKAPPLAVVAAASVPSAAVAAVGTIVKWVDLSRRIDQLMHKGPAITYSLPLPMEMNSRLGDRLVAYLHAKYVAEKCGIPLYFQPFDGAEFFRFSEQEPLKSDPAKPLHFQQVVHLKPGTDIEALIKQTDKAASVLYVLPFFPHSRVETEGPRCSYIKYPIDWQAFKPTVKQLLEVVKPHRKIPIPADAFSIALHIRTGGTYDTPDTCTMLPAKLPPLSYYVGELKKLLVAPDTPKNKPIFVHLFTDDPTPKNLCERLQKELSDTILALGDQKVIWSYTEKPELVDDIANMRHFQCLIRPDSNLSGTLAKGADHSVEIFPTHFKVNPQWTEISIDEVGVVDASNAEKRRSTNYTMSVVKRWFLPSYFYKWFHHAFVGVDSHVGAEVLQTRFQQSPDDVKLDG